MARTPRLHYPGAIHHVFNRGPCKAPIFLDDEDKARFLALLATLPERFGIHVLAYALMTNHYHLVLVDPRGQLSAAMHSLLSRYAQGTNRRHERDGSPFRGRFANRLVETTDYLRNLFAYVHLNPVRAGMAAAVTDAAWTSHRAAIGLERCPRWLDRSWVGDVYGGPRSFMTFVAAYDPAQEPTPPDDVEPSPVSAVYRTSGAPPALATSVAAAFALVARVTGTSRERARSARGRVGEFVAWVLCTRAGLTQREAAAVVRTSHTAVGHRVRRFESWSTSAIEGARWREDALSALETWRDLSPQKTSLESA